MGRGSPGIVVFFALVLIGLLSIFQKQADALGCIPKICEGNGDNDIRPCLDQGSCGAYGGKRQGGRIVQGVDINCHPQREIFAPFAGTISFSRPYRDGNCIDSGITIQGNGAWQGYVAVISFVRPYRYGGQVKAGDAIGKSLPHTCIDQSDSNYQSHVLFQLYKQGQVIDPTNHLHKCMCTGQICETNFNNEIVGKPFAYKHDYGKGYEIKCSDPKADSEGLIRAPQIHSPIDGSMLGRFRPKSIAGESVSKGYACDNDGVFIKGSGKWQDFTAHIYNAKFMLEPGQKDIRQGQAIATKLECPGQKYDSVFVEIRHKGRLVNMTDLVLATDCKLPETIQ
jgi:hypothetical protein